MNLERRFLRSGLFLLVMCTYGCGNDDAATGTGTDGDTDSDTDSGTETETQTDSDSEMPTDLGVCETVIVSINDILTPLEGLPFDEFMDAAMNEMNKRSPQKVTQLGLDEALGMDSHMLDDITYGSTNK